MIDFFNDLLQVLDKIEGISAIGLVFLSCIAIGYVLRFIKRFPNDGIPVAVILWGAFAMLFLSDSHPAAMPMRVWVFRNAVIGLIVGFISWLTHKIALSKIEDFIAKKFPDVGNTQFFTKGPVAPTPVPVSVVEQAPENTQKPKE